MLWGYRARLANESVRDEHVARCPAPARGERYGAKNLRFTNAAYS